MMIGINEMLQVGMWFTARKNGVFKMPSAFFKFNFTSSLVTKIISEPAVHHPDKLVYFRPALDAKQIRILKKFLSKNIVINNQLCQPVYLKCNWKFLFFITSFYHNSGAGSFFKFI